MPTAEAFWDRSARAYARKPIADMEAYERTLERSRVHLATTDRVLEVGCGTGSTALRLAPHVAHITGSDVSARMIEIARDKAEVERVDNVEFVQGDVLDGGLGTGPFDLVLAFNLLHLLEDPAAACRRIHARLRPGGLFISKTTCLAGHGRLLRLMIRAMQAIGRAPYVKIMDIDELERSIAGASFEILETGLYPASPPSRFVVARRT